MDVIAVGKIKTHFPEILKELKHGKSVGILFDSVKTPVAMIVPYIEEKKAKQERRQRLIRFSSQYDPMALAGSAESSPLDLTQIRKEWTKKK